MSHAASSHQVPTCEMSNVTLRQQEKFLKKKHEAVHLVLHQELLVISTELLREQMPSLQTQGEGKSTKALLPPRASLAADRPDLKG